MIFEARLNGALNAGLCRPDQPSLGLKAKDNCIRRPTCTRRLSIAAILSLLAFVVVAGAGVRSLRISDEWHFGSWRTITLANGCIEYSHWWGSAVPAIKGPPVTGHRSSKTSPQNSSRGFGMYEHDFVTTIPRATETVFVAWTSLWVPFFLLLVAPVRWVFSRPRSAAFPVVTDANRESDNHASGASS